jgi:hypothetical protein
MSHEWRRRLTRDLLRWAYRAYAASDALQQRGLALVGVLRSVQLRVRSPCAPLLLGHALRHVGLEVESVVARVAS